MFQEKGFFFRTPSHACRTFLGPRRLDLRTANPRAREMRPPFWVGGPLAQIPIFVHPLAGRPQSTSASRFGADPRLQLPFLGGAYSI